jgi:hypothetical protein
MKNGKTADAMALEIFLVGGPNTQEKLTALRCKCDNMTNGGACPNCGFMGPHDDNGCSGANLTFLCRSCSWQWDAINV